MKGAEEGQGPARRRRTNVFDGKGKGQGKGDDEEAPGEVLVGMANPASVNCNDVGGTSIITLQEDGGQYGVCAAGEMACEEWSLFRGECDLETHLSFLSYCETNGGVSTRAIPPTCIIEGEEVCSQEEYYTTGCKGEDPDGEGLDDEAYDPFLGITVGSTMSMSMPTAVDMSMPANGGGSALSMSMPVSTDKDIVVTPSDEDCKSILELAKSDDRLSTLVKAIVAADLVDALSGAGPLTVFAPTDKAFEALPEGALENILAEENKDQLANVLKYHVVSGQPSPSAMSVMTLGGQELELKGVLVVGVELEACNGVVNVIDRVLIPPICSNSDDCRESEFCKKEEGDCDGEGVCAARPEAYITLYDPVCGCDGDTYSNTGAASAGGSSVAYWGECKEEGSVLDTVKDKGEELIDKGKELVENKREEYEEALKGGGGDDADKVIAGAKELNSPAGRAGAVAALGTALLGALVVARLA